MKVFWFDTETSGLLSFKNGIISLAYCIEIDGKIKEESILYSNCQGKEIEQAAMKVNGFSEDEIKTFGSPKKLYTNLITLLSKYVDKYNKEDKFTAAGYNIDFDMNFLRQLWKDNKDNYFGSFFSYGTIDPSAIIRFLQYGNMLPNLTKLRLTDVAEHFNIDSSNAHDAMADVKMTIAVTEKIMDILHEY